MSRRKFLSFTSQFRDSISFSLYDERACCRSWSEDMVGEGGWAEAVAIGSG